VIEQINSKLSVIGQTAPSTQLELVAFWCFA
jgi:hypothetical protein